MTNPTKADGVSLFHVHSKFRYVYVSMGPFVSTEIRPSKVQVTEDVCLVSKSRWDRPNQAGSVAHIPRYYKSILNLESKNI